MLRTYSHLHGLGVLSGTIGVSPDNTVTNGLLTASEFWQSNSYVSPNLFVDHADAAVNWVGSGTPTISNDSLVLSSNKYVRSPVVAGIEPFVGASGSDRTYVLWFKYSSIGTYGSIFSLNRSTNIESTVAWNLIKGDASDIYVLSDEGNGATAYELASTSWPFSSNTWTMITVRANWDGNITFHKDKSTSAFLTGSLVPHAGLQDLGTYVLRVGGRSGFGGSFSGSIGAAYAYDRNLSNTEIATIYDGTVGKLGS